MPTKKKNCETLQASVMTEGGGNFSTIIPAPPGNLLLTANADALTIIRFTDEPVSKSKTSSPLLQEAGQQLKAWLSEQEKAATGTDKAHYLLALERMKAPEKAKPTIHKEIPPGAPIGCEAEF